MTDECGLSECWMLAFLKDDYKNLMIGQIWTYYSPSQREVRAKSGYFWGSGVSKTEGLRLGKHRDIIINNAAIDMGVQICKVWKQPNCQWMNKSQKCVNIYITSVLKKKENAAICENIDEPWSHKLNKISQRKTNTAWCHLYVKSNNSRKKIGTQKHNRKVVA